MELGRGMAWLALSGSIWLSAPEGPLPAQVIRGRVMDETNRLPVASAGVTLHDPGGAILSSALTDRAGRYLLTAPGPGRYQLRVEGLGYSDFASPLIDVGELPEYELGSAIREWIGPPTHQA